MSELDFGPHIKCHQCGTLTPVRRCLEYKGKTFCGLKCKLKYKEYKMRKLIMAVIIGIWPALVMATEMPEPYVTKVSKGMFCDSVEDVRSYLSMVALENGEPANPPASCKGVMLMYRITVTVQPIEWYETPQVISLIASLTDQTGVPKYGWVKFIPNPTFKPASLDPEA